jgi:serine/threonine protein kinase
MITAQTDQLLTLHIPRLVGDYFIQKVVGNGCSSVVVEGSHLFSGKQYAIKVLSSKDAESRGRTNILEQEIAIVQEFDHPYICKFVEIIRLDGLVFIAMEKCDSGDLLSRIIDRGTPKKCEFVPLFKQIEEAICHIHQKGCAHADLKPENVMLDHNGKVKLIDFGFAKRNLTAGEGEKGGTFTYAAPKLFKKGIVQTQKVDIWALAIVLFAMTTPSLLNL